MQSLVEIKCYEPNKTTTTFHLQLHHWRITDLQLPQEVHRTTNRVNCQHLKRKENEEALTCNLSRTLRWWANIIIFWELAFTSVLFESSPSVNIGWRESQSRNPSTLEIPSTWSESSRSCPPLSADKRKMHHLKVKTIWCHHENHIYFETWTTILDINLFLFTTLSNLPYQHILVELWSM